MSPQFINELFQDLHSQGNGPLKVQHPSTGEICWIISDSAMERFRPLFQPDPLSSQEKAFLLRQAGERAGWDDPEMDAYDNYDQSPAEQS